MEPPVKIRNLLAILLGIVASALVICAVWMPQDWGWLKFSLTALIIAIVAIFLAASEDAQKRP